MFERRARLSAQRVLVTESEQLPLQRLTLARGVGREQHCCQEETAQSKRSPVLWYILTNLNLGHKFMVHTHGLQYIASTAVPWPVLTGHCARLYPSWRGELDSGSAPRSITMLPLAYYQ